MEIGELIKQRRLELKLTLEDVGNAVGVGKSTVKKWEDGYIANMKRDKIAALANILQLNPIILMGCESTSFPSSTKVVNYHLTPDEVKLITVYRNNPDIRAKIQAFLEVNGEPLTPAPTHNIKIAAYGGGVMDHKTTATDEEIKEALEESEDDQYIMKNRNW